MAYIGREIPVFDLTGGQASNRPITSLDPNQALELDNVHSLPGGGIKLRQGDTAVNSSAFASGNAFTGLQYYKLANDTEFLAGVAGTVVGKMDYSTGAPDGTWDTITGSLSLTGGQNNLWHSFVANNIAYFVGGANDTAFTWTGTGNATAIGGTFPDGKFGFFHNNRIFVGNTTANPSRLAHSTLSDLEDFSGDGSGTVDVDPDDGDKLIGAAPLNTDVVLLFKRNSIHQLVTTSAPFSRFPLYRNIGLAGSKALVIHQGVAFFITPQGRMKATNGSEVIDFPPDMDDVWNSIPKDRLQYVQGYFDQGKDFRHIKWIVSSSGSSSNDLCIVWDLDKKSWWRNTTGHKMNAITHDITDDIIYAGHYDGVTYQKNIENIFTDASESGVGISGFWRWGWHTDQSFQTALQIQRLNVSFLGQTSGNLQVQYGFNFIKDKLTVDLDMTVAGGQFDIDTWDLAQWGGQSDDIDHLFILGRGNAFNVKFSNAEIGQAFQLNGFTISGKAKAQKNIEVS